MKRDKEFKIRMNEEELESLNLKVELCKCSREKFVRDCLSHSVPKVPPPLEYHHLINEFNTIGRNLNQLIKLCYVQQIDCCEMENMAIEFKRLIQDVDNMIHHDMA